MPREKWKATAGSDVKTRAKKGAGPNKKRQSSPALFKLIKSQKWSECLRWSSSHPEDVRHVEDGMSVLHFALHKRPEISDAPLAHPKEAVFLEFIDFLMKTMPELISSVEGLGYTPLHVACSTNSCAHLVRMILNRCPPSSSSLEEILGMPLDVSNKMLEFLSNPALMKDKQGKTPLFLACQRSKKRKNKPRTDVVKLLLEYAPEAMSIQDKTSRSPLDVAMHQGKSQDLVELLSKQQNRAEHPQ